MTHDVRIVMEQQMCTKVFIDGVQVKGLLGIDLVARPNQLVEVVLTIMPKSLEITGLADVVEKIAELR